MFSISLPIIVLTAALAMVKAQYGDCPCPPVPPGPWQIGFPINAVPAPPSAIECAYPNGACVWDAVSTLTESCVDMNAEGYVRLAHCSIRTRRIASPISMTPRRARMITPGHQAS